MNIGLETTELLSRRVEEELERIVEQLSKLQAAASSSFFDEKSANYHDIAEALNKAHSEVSQSGNNLDSQAFGIDKEVSSALSEIQSDITVAA
jgi:uncharacterized protein YdaU (DUF1376 family)